MAMFTINVIFIKTVPRKIWFEMWNGFNWHRRDQFLWTQKYKYTLQLYIYIYIYISCSFIIKQFKLNIKKVNNIINIHQSDKCANECPEFDIKNTDTNLSRSKFPSNHLKLERSPGVIIFTHACGTVTVAQISSGRCRYDPHFPP